MKLIVFGSLSRGDFHDKSDVDVLITSDNYTPVSDGSDEFSSLLSQFQKYTIEKGGQLDLFADGNETLWAVYDSDFRRIHVDKYLIEDLNDYGKEVTPEQLLMLIEMSTPEERYRFLQSLTPAVA